MELPIMLWLILGTTLGTTLLIVVTAGLRGRRREPPPWPQHRQHRDPYAPLHEDGRGR